MSSHIPTIAILAPNPLMGIGLKAILEKMLPFAAFKVCDDFADIEASAPEELFHIFASASIVMEHIDFFEKRRNKSIILTNGTPLSHSIEGYPQINIAAPQAQIEASIRNLHSSVHGAQPSHHNTTQNPKEPLSQREIDVLKLVVEGYINKEIAQRLGIATATVISHRKNIVEKLGIRSVAGLTIYAVMKHYIEI